MRICDNHLLFEHKEGKQLEKSWSYSLTFANITGVSVMTGESVSARRMALVGVLAIAWRKQDPYLVITAQLGSLEASIVLHSTKQQIERAYRQVFRAVSDSTKTA